MIRTSLYLVTALGLAACSGGSSTGPVEPTPPSESSTTPPDTTPPPPSEEAKKGLQRKEPLPDAVRRAIEGPMRRHAGYMESLMWAALGLDYDQTAKVARLFEEEPKIARPQSDDTVNAIIPEPFFQLQDQLHESALELATAAEARDDAAMADSFSKLTSTCVRCHSLYLRIPAQ